MRLLLDTHVVLWWGQQSRRLKAPLRRQIARADDVFVSAASAWEIAVKVSLGKLRVLGPLREIVESSRFTRLPIDFAHAEAVKGLPLLHGDPFDRILSAQAQVEGLHLVTSDETMARYPIAVVRA